MLRRPVLPWICLGEIGCRHFQFSKVAWWRGRARSVDPLAAGGRPSQYYTPPWPVPKLFRLTAKGAFNNSIFNGATINTPSMLVIEDAIDALTWAKSIGGLPALIARSESSLEAVRAWVETSPYFDFLAEDPATVSNTGITLKVTDPWFVSLDDNRQAAIAAQLYERLQDEGVAFDAASYRDAAGNPNLGWTNGRDP